MKIALLAFGAMLALSSFPATAKDNASPFTAITAIYPEGTPPRVAVPAPKDPRFAHLSWPKVLRTARGNVVLAYIAGTFHGDGGGGSPAVSLSTDNGKSFGPPHLLREFGPGKKYTQSGNLALGEAEDGALVLLAMAYDGVKGNDIFGWRSTDQGKSWRPTDTSALGPNKTGSVFGNILPIPGKGLMVLGHYRPGSLPHQRGTWLSISTDNGLSWGPPQRITETATVEPVLVRSQDSLLAFLRGNGDGKQTLAVSRDLGTTWKVAATPFTAQPPAHATLAAPSAVLNPQNADELFVLTTERDKANGSGRIWLWKGSAQALQWQRQRVLLQFPKTPKEGPRDFGYPWLLHLEGKRWLMFYYHGQMHGPSPIWVTEVEL